MNLIFALALGAAYATETKTNEVPAQEAAQLNELQKTLEASLTTEEKQIDETAPILGRAIASERPEE